MGKQLQVIRYFETPPDFFSAEFLKEPKMKLLALLLIATVFVCVSCEEKKSDAEKKEAMKNSVQDKKRAKDLEGGKRLAVYKNFSVQSLEEVTFEGGSAVATSEYSSAYTAKLAFNQITHGWRNDADIEALPSMVWYEFPANKSFIPGRVSFRPRQDWTGATTEGPSMWQFVASNDVLCHKRGRAHVESVSLSMFAFSEEMISLPYDALSLI